MRMSSRTAIHTTALVALGLPALIVSGCESRHGRPERDQGRVISVCDVLADLDSYRDRIAAVRGVFTYRGLRQDGCPTELITGNRHWPPVLDLAAVEGVWQRDGQKFTFRTDHAGWDGLERTAIEAGKQGQSVEIWVTIVGQVGAVERRVLPDGRVIGGGYGHLGALPAELVVKEVKDVVVKPVPRSRYDYRLGRAGPA